MPHFAVIRRHVCGENMPYGHYLYQWIDIPIYAAKNMRIDELAFDIRRGKFMIVLDKNSTINYYKGKAQFSLKDVEQDRLPIVMLTPLDQIGCPW